MGITRAFVLFFLLLDMAYSIDMKGVISSIDKDFHSPSNNASIKQDLSKEPLEQENLLDILSKQVWSSFDTNAPIKIHSQDLRKILDTKKISYIKSTKNYTGIIDYVEKIIDVEFTNYLMWVIIIQSFVIILFIILYIDLNWQIKSIKSKIVSKNIDTIAPEVIVHDNRVDNLRKLFL